MVKVIVMVVMTVLVMMLMLLLLKFEKGKGEQIMRMRSRMSRMSGCSILGSNSPDIQGFAHFTHQCSQTSTSVGGRNVEN